MIRCSFGAMLFVFLAAIADAGDAPPDNRLVRELTTQGVRLGDGPWVKLPAPTLVDGLDVAAQRAIVERAAGRYGKDRFTRDSAVAPFSLKLAYLKGADGERIGHSADLWFVAHGNLATLKDEQLLEDLVQPGSEKDSPFTPEARELDDEQLAVRSIQRLTGCGEEKYVFARFSVLNRVYLSGVGNAVYTESPQSLVVAWRLDPRFADDADFASRWQPIETDELGKRKLGVAQPYGGYGGYAKITTLDEPAGALFVESHVVFHEPSGWFRGSNLLRSKMPLAIQENVRKFRRQLAKASPPTPGQ